MTRCLQVSLAIGVILLVSALPTGGPSVEEVASLGSIEDARTRGGEDRSSAASLVEVATVDEAAGPSRVADLRGGIERMVASTGWRNSEWSILAVSLSGGDTLVSLDPDRALVPASNQKLLTSAAALHYLGPDYRFPTYLLADGRVSDGVLEGDLVLYGTGDPALSDRRRSSGTPPLFAFARAVREAGIHEIRGDILGDGTFFEGPSRRGGWDPRSLNDWYAAPASALSFNENVATLRIRPSVAGTRPRVLTIPEGADLRLENRALSVAGRPSSAFIAMRDDPDMPIVLRGELTQGSREVWRVITVPDPPAYAASVLRHTLEAEGIRVVGAARSVPDRESSLVSGTRIVAPAFANGSGDAGRSLRTVAVHYSPPVRDLLPVVNMESHNLYAELLLHSMGRTVEGTGSFDEGARVLARYLSDVVGAEGEGFHLEDGSGLSRQNRLTAGALVRVLAHMSEAEHSDVFWASLPEAGNRRGLGRMYRTAAAGNLRAKTGTIRGVSSLSGIVRTGDGEPVVFSILANGVPSSQAKRVEDQIGIRLASFSRAQAPEPGRILPAAARSVPVTR